MFRPALAIPCVPLLLLSFACSGDDGGTTKSSADPTNGDGSDGDPTDNGDGPTTTMGASTGGPVVMELLASAASITEKEPITFTAIVLDPDGLDTIVGGKLMTGDGEGFYGAFAHIGGGTFQIVLTWELIGQSSEIEFMAPSQVRVFMADFIDVDGNHATKTIEITLTCDTAAACNSDCVDLMYDDENCGKCGEVCADIFGPMTCDNGYCGYGY